MEDEMSGESASKREALIKRIRALQSKTLENGCTEQEALAATELAAKLIDKFGFDQSELEMKLEPLTEDTYLGPYKTLQGSLFVAMATASYCDVHMFRAHNGRRWILKTFGRESDVAVANYLLNMFATAFMSEWREYCKSYSARTGQAMTVERGKLKKAFDLGMGNRLSKRLKEMKEARNKHIDPNSGRTGQDLVVLKNAVVDEEFAKRYKTKSRSTRGSPINADAYHAGQAAGDRVAINPGVGTQNAPLAIR
jgi:Protein of unknown function (DUF2786)